MMLNASDLLSMEADLEAIRGDNEISIVIRRGSSTLEAQSVRIAYDYVGRHGF